MMKKTKQSYIAIIKDTHKINKPKPTPQLRNENLYHEILKTAIMVLNEFRKEIKVKIPRNERITRLKTLKKRINKQKV